MRHQFVRRCSRGSARRAVVRRAKSGGGKGDATLAADWREVAHGGAASSRTSDGYRMAVGVATSPFPPARPPAHRAIHPQRRHHLRSSATSQAPTQGVHRFACKVLRQRARHLMSVQSAESNLILFHVWFTLDSVSAWVF
jgi:hypothetical protein